MSSYFFFLKNNGLPWTEQRNNLIRYCVRILKLYLFWFVLLLPFTIIIKGWYSIPIASFIPYFLKHLFFGSTFKASWYLMASVLGLAVVFYLSKYLKNWILLSIGSVLYLFCCLSTNYYGLLDGFPMVASVMTWTISHIGHPHNSFMVALLWIAIGRSIAQKHVWLDNRLLIWFLLASLVLLYVEYFILNGIGFVKTNDCYLMLLPSCIFLFVLIGQNEFRIHPWINATRCRKLSTIVYCSHLTIAWLVGGLLHYAHFPYSSIVVFIITLTLSMALGFLILNMEEKHRIAILRYSH